jgi:hypothetical protein
MMTLEAESHAHSRLVQRIVLYSQTPAGRHLGRRGRFRVNPFAVWLYWSTVWVEWTALWWKLALSPPDSSTLTAEERRRLEILRQRFATEVAQRQIAAQENTP